MNIFSLICEFDPFHNGHKYLLDYMRTKGADCIIACMSGNFTQRGEPAAFDKYLRTEAALKGGADLIIELPVSFACAGAERFAGGGVFLLDSLGCVDSLFFGSEAGSIDRLKKAADILGDEALGSCISSFLSEGISYAAAREKAVEKLTDTETGALLRHPNNNLAVEYLKALSRLDSRITPVTAVRMGAGHHSADTKDNYASGSQIRKMLIDGDDITPFVPLSTAELIKKDMTMPLGTTRGEMLEKAMLYRLRTMTPEELSLLPGMSEGLENRIYKAVRSGTSVKEITELAKTKRYPMARIKRALVHALLGMRNDDLPPHPLYIRVLGFNGRGRDALQIIKRNSSLPIVTRAAEVSGLEPEAKRMFEFECRCDDIYALSGREVISCGYSMRKGPHIL